MKLTTKRLKEMIEKELEEVHQHVHDEMELQDTVLLMAQAANRVLDDKHPGLLTHEQVHRFLDALQMAITSIIEEFTTDPEVGDPGEGPSRRGDFEQHTPIAKFRE